MNAPLLFNLKNHVPAQDFVGTQLTNLAAARREAVKDIADIMKSRSGAVGVHWPEWSIEICDEDQRVLLVVPFSSN